MSGRTLNSDFAVAMMLCMDVVTADWAARKASSAEGEGGTAAEASASVLLWCSWVSRARACGYLTVAEQFELMTRDKDV